MNDFYSLDSILQQMICKRKDNPSAYKRYSRLLIGHQMRAVLDYTMSKMLACFLPEPVPANQLVFRDPNAVTSFFVNLCSEYPWIVTRELTDDQPTRRYRLALIMRSLFSLKKSLPTIDVCKELFTDRLLDIWHHFTRLLSDPVPHVRRVCVQTIDILLSTEFDEEIVTDLVSHLITRLRDVEHRIRYDAVSVVDHCHRSENILDRILMRHFVARIGDRELEVRKQALICVSNVFHTIYRKYRRTEQPFIYKLPTACLLRYQFTDIEEEKALIELIFTVNLCNKLADPVIKMRDLIKLICVCDDTALKSISKVFRSQHRLRTLFAKLVVAVERHSFKKSIVSCNTKVYESLSKAFEYIQDVDQVLSNFHLLLKECDQEVIESVKCVFEPSISCQESVQAIDRMFDTSRRQSVDKVFVIDDGMDETLIELKSEIHCRLGIGLIDSNCLVELFELMSEVDGRYAQRLASLIVILSNCYRYYFEDQSSAAVTDGLLELPNIILAWIASDSVLPYLQCPDNLKILIKQSLK